MNLKEQKILLALIFIIAILTLFWHLDEKSYTSISTDMLAQTINNATSEVQLTYMTPVNLDECSLYFTDDYRKGRDTFFRAITYSNSFKSPCDGFSIKLAKVLRYYPDFIGITAFELQCTNLWLKYRSSKYSHIQEHHYKEKFK
ncbi:hypothetical protein BH10PSE19_BH10PSE19_00200 [soil metagenome]